MTEKIRTILFKFFKKDSFPGKLIDKFFTREIITYLIFGVLTTAVNLISFYLIKKFFIAVEWSGVFNALIGSAGWDNALELVGKGTDYLDATVIAWLIAVIFAFITNKLVVFESKSWTPKIAGKEFFAFMGARLFSLAVEMAGMFVMVTLLAINEYIAKIAVGIIVIIINYVFSKLFIFKSK